MPHSNLLELKVTEYYSSDKMISIASNKKKGFTLSCGASLEDVVKSILACPSCFFISNNSYDSMISIEDALNAIYAPMKKI